MHTFIFLFVLHCLERVKRNLTTISTKYKYRCYNGLFLFSPGTQQCSVDALAFETLIPKSIVQRYVSLLLEHRRIILCGPSGTGKTYLAERLAEYLVQK
jgi:SpoVK/Ycf46/Vps4 family AAA+-type ATPase